MTTPSVCQIVLYKLSQSDADALVLKLAHGGLCNLGKQGDVFPAMIVRTWGQNPEWLVQLQVFIDGGFSLWVSRVSEGEDPGQYTWQAWQGSDDVQGPAA